MSFVPATRIRRAIGRVLAVSALGVLASTGVAAAASCAPSPVSKPFARWGDNRAYFLPPVGAFEGTASQLGLTLSGAALTPGNEPFYLHSTSDSQSLTINPWGSVTTPFTCIDSTMPGFRFMTRQLGRGSFLSITILVRSQWGTFTVPVPNLADGSAPSWGPSPLLGPALSAVKVPVGITYQAALRFQVIGFSSWQIDDLFVDPYRSS